MEEKKVIRMDEHKNKNKVHKLSGKKILLGIVAVLILTVVIIAGTPKKGESVPVLIWEISPRDEFNLDRYEGYPRLYGKEMLEVELDGKREKMMAYTMTDGYAMGVPSEHYLATIRTGYQEAGFDEDVLMAGVEKSRERMKQEMEAERMEEAPWSQQLPL